MREEMSCASRGALQAVKMLISQAAQTSSLCTILFMRNVHLVGRGIAYKSSNKEKKYGAPDHRAKKDIKAPIQRQGDVI
jgi:hypothetical protein